MRYIVIVAILFVIILAMIEADRDCMSSHCPPGMEPVMLADTYQCICAHKPVFQ